MSEDLAMNQSNEIDLEDRGIDELQAADLRARLKTFAEDWNLPEADIYDEDLRGDVRPAPSKF
jgi:hypothetical protein